MSVPGLGEQREQRESEMWTLRFLLILLAVEPSEEPAEGFLRRAYTSKPGYYKQLDGSCHIVGSIAKGEFGFFFCVIELHHHFNISRRRATSSGLKG